MIITVAAHKLVKSGEMEWSVVISTFLKDVQLNTEPCAPPSEGSAKGQRPCIENGKDPGAYTYSKVKSN